MELQFFSCPCVALPEGEGGLSLREGVGVGKRCRGNLHCCSTLHLLPLGGIPGSPWKLEKTE